MKKYMLLILMALLSVVVSSVSAKQAEASSDLADSLVWEITGPGLDKPSYLVGTLHLMCKKDFSLDDRYQTAIDQTKQLYLEMDMDDNETIAKLQKSMFVDEPLSERLSSAQYQQLNEYIKTNTKLNIDMMDKMDFLAIQSTLLVSSMGCPIKSVELELMTMAKEAGQEVLGLETAEQQMKVVKVLAPPKKEHAWSEEEFEMYIGSVNSFDEMLNTYKQQDISELYQYIHTQISGLENSKHIIETILDDRNKNWVEKMPEIMQTQPTFFAVGSGHLAGEFGVINLLRQTGFTVKPVME